MEKTNRAEREDLLRLLPERRDESHKGTYGKLLLIAGSRNMCGAAYLAALAAYRSGTGLVYLYTPECNRVILQQLIPEAVLITWEEENWRPEGLKQALRGKDALAIGPGMGTGKIQEEILKYTLSSPLPMVLDADALNLLAANPEFWQLRQGISVVTPHRMEFCRMTGQRLEQIEAHPREAACSFAAERQVVTVLKGHHTIVTDGLDIYVNRSGNHGMATAGSGDVLTGVIGGLLAQGLCAADAAKLGVYIHGLAGDRARDLRGARSMMARDIAENILWKI